MKVKKNDHIAIETMTTREKKLRNITKTFTLSFTATETIHDLPNIILM